MEEQSSCCRAKWANRLRWGLEIRKTGRRISSFSPSTPLLYALYYKETRRLDCARLPVGTNDSRVGVGYKEISLPPAGLPVRVAGKVMYWPV